jgi:2,4-dienoyl-CoA reductase-like NADH-dependent reductase (Old Yellow Enzyme family)/thioredoxin reductase
MMQATLFSPLTVNGLVLKNRIVMAPMGVCLASETGAVTPALIEFYRERARGDAALILVGGGQVSERRPPGLLALNDDHMIPGLNDLAEAVQQEGARIGMQLNISDHFLPDHMKRTPDNLTLEEIAIIIQSLVKAAVRVREAGFDVVEFHGAHGYLISQFFSSLSNHRSDRYGGNMEGRQALALEVLRATRDKLGSRFPIFFRMNGSDMMNGGVEIGEAVRNARALEQAGVDALDVSAGRRPFTDHFTMQPMGQPNGGLVHLAEAVKKEVGIPVLTAGKIDAALADLIIRKGQADLVSMGRGLIADPCLPLKTKAGRIAEIRTCLYCNYCVTQRTRLKKRIRCSINASAGREHECRIQEARGEKRVLVIGGGPAGLECARVLGLRGHAVTLAEKEDRLGGQAWLASVPARKEAIRRFVALLEQEIRRLGIRIDCGREIRAEDIGQLKADADVVVLASGALPLVPPIPGIQGAKIRTGFEVLESEGEGLGTRIAVIGGGDVGCEVAEFLAEKGKDVTIIEQLAEIGSLLEPYTHRFFMERLSRIPITVRINQRVTRIEECRIYFADPDGKVSHGEFDHVVLCVGTVGNDGLLSTLLTHFPEVYSIGDCVHPKNIYQAVSDGARIGRLV